MVRRTDDRLVGCKFDFERDVHKPQSVLWSGLRYDKSCGGDWIFSVVFFLLPLLVWILTLASFEASLL